MSARRLAAGPAAVSGNGVVLDVRRDGDAWLVEFMAEPRRSAESLWFHLECAGAGGRRIRFAWLNAHLCLGMGDAQAVRRVRPVVRLDGGEWQRVRRVEVLERPSGGHVLRFATPGPCRRAAVAFCYPYPPETLEATLQEAGGCWHAETIGLTGAGRPLQRLRALPRRRSRPRPGAYVVARQHAGETPGSWVLDGMLRAISGDGASGLLRRVEWCVVPFVDLDGVVQGDYGKDSLPIDFNRTWAPLTLRPEVRAIQRDMGCFAQRTRPRFVLDLHAPAGAEDRLYQFHCRDNRPPAQRRAGRSFTPFLVAEMPEMPADSLARVPAYASRWDANHTLTAWAWDGLDRTTAAVIEVAYQLMSQGRWSEPDDYRECGRRVARAVASWLLKKQRRGGRGAS